MLDSLGRRPRGKRAVAALQALREGPPGRTFQLLGRPAPEGTPPGLVTRALVERLGDDLGGEMIRRLPPAERQAWDEASDEERLFLAVPWALWLDVPDAERRTGLSRAMPPEEVHAMSHAPLATGGSTYYADLIAESLDAVGAPLAPGQEVLDFGCSSGRVARVLKAWQPEANYAGCDPNAPAIEWASTNLPDIRFTVSPLRPPLPDPSDSFDLIYAISVWSHFAEGPAVEWLGEMARIVRPGGHLLLTTQGFTAIQRFVEVDPAAAEHYRGVVQALYDQGFSYFAAFEPGTGDWGVPAEDWGMGFLTPEWLLDRVTPLWSVELFRSGRSEGSQDVWVLRRGEG